MARTSSTTSLKFKASLKFQGKTNLLSELPEQYSRYQILHSEVKYYKAPFGSYFTQEIKDKKWAISWFHGFFDRRITLFSITASPMVSLICVMENDVSSFLEGHGRLLLKQGKFGLYYIPPNIFSKINIKKKNYSIICFSIAEELLAEFIDLHPHFKNVYDKQKQCAEKGEEMGTFPIGPNVLDILDSIKNIGSLGAAWRIILSNKVSGLLTLYYTMLKESEKRIAFHSNKWESVIEQMAQYIRMHCSDPLTISTLAKTAGMNTDTFTREFKKHHRQTPWSFLMKCRIQQATTLLLETNDTILNIGNKVGYTGINYFSNAFKKQFGCSPLQYRSKWKANTINNYKGKRNIMPV